ncbi:LLM class flavin-dependent oxidoreductase [Nocardioides sp. TF02-7]|uniref:LLM class flavin-dependent oxidoreductase n=1 Tax=Nocardioides sp. TF02-7 TaxID=2917724 RepID=UPI001F053E9A|nr:LLM class flavin-dependent oxidoreductase [Nocardioides sp. TF02-7]UMG94059.1 LLM class flavin-dependent oxidoreductase [Nocardioides sp. TF02-7]
MDDRQGARGGRRRGGATPDALTFCVAAPAYVGDDTPSSVAHMRDQTRWFGGMVGNHIADIVSKHGEDAEFPRVLIDYIKGRTGYDYNTHGRADNDHVQFVPDEVVDRFCILGTAEQHVRKLMELKAIGVDQFAIYLQHDNKGGRRCASTASRSCRCSASTWSPRRSPCGRRPAGCRGCAPCSSASSGWWPSPACGRPTRPSAPTTASWSATTGCSRAPPTSRCRTSGTCSPGSRSRSPAWPAPTRCGAWSSTRPWCRSGSPRSAGWSARRSGWRWRCSCSGCGSRSGACCRGSCSARPCR